MKNHLLNYKSTITSAIEILQKLELKLVILVDDNNILKGTITDGDIRRGLLKGIAVDSLCENIMNKNPVYIHDNDYNKLRDDLIKEKIIIPIINKSNQVIDICTSIMSKNDNSDTPVIIMAGGKGTRLSPLTKTTPKPLLLVQNKPIIQNIIENLRESGFNNIYLSLHYKAQNFIEYFGNGERFGIKISYLVEKKPLGTAGCLTLLKKNPITKNIMVVNGDILTMMNFAQFLKFHNKTKKLISICGAEHHIEVPYATLSIDDDKLIEISEKPTIKHYINAGIYLLSMDVIKKMQKGIKIDMPDLLSPYIKKKEISVYPLYEDWIDIGTHEEYEKVSGK